MTSTTPMRLLIGMPDARVREHAPSTGELLEDVARGDREEETRWAVLRDHLVDQGLDDDEADARILHLQRDAWSAAGIAAVVRWFAAGTALAGEMRRSIEVEVGWHPEPTSILIVSGRRRPMLTVSVARDDPRGPRASIQVGWLWVAGRVKRGVLPNLL